MSLIRRQFYSLIIKTAAKAASLYVNIFKIDVPGKMENKKYL